MCSLRHFSNIFPSEKRHFSVNAAGIRRGNVACGSPVMFTLATVEAKGSHRNNTRNDTHTQKKRQRRSLVILKITPIWRLSRSHGLSTTRPHNDTASQSSRNNYQGAIYAQNVSTSVWCDGGERAACLCLMKCKDNIRNKRAGFIAVLRVKQSEVDCLLGLGGSDRCAV